MILGGSDASDRCLITWYRLESAALEFLLHHKTLYPWPPWPPISSSARTLHRHRAYPLKALGELRSNRPALHACAADACRFRRASRLLPAGSERVCCCVRRRTVLAMTLEYQHHPGRSRFLKLAIATGMWGSWRAGLAERSAGSMSVRCA